MTKEDKKAIRRIKRLMDKCIDLHLRACGYELEVYKACEAGVDVLEAIEAAIESAHKQSERGVTA